MAQAHLACHLPHSAVQTVRLPGEVADIVEKARGVHFLKGTFAVAGQGKQLLTGLDLAYSAQILLFTLSCDFLSLELDHLEGNIIREGVKYFV